MTKNRLIARGLIPVISHLTREITTEKKRHGGLLTTVFTWCRMPERGWYSGCHTVNLPKFINHYSDIIPKSRSYEKLA